MATVTRPLSGAAATFPAGANQIRLAAGAPTKIRLAAAGDFFRRRRNSARPRERRHITLLVSLVWNTWYQTFCNLLFTDVLSVIESANLRQRQNLKQKWSVIRIGIFGLIWIRMSVVYGPKLWMHYLVGISHFARYGTNRLLNERMTENDHITSALLAVVIIIINVKKLPVLNDKRLEI